MSDLAAAIERFLNSRGTRRDLRDLLRRAAADDAAAAERILGVFGDPERQARALEKLPDTSALWSMLRMLEPADDTQGAARVRGEDCARVIRSLVALRREPAPPALERVLERLGAEPEPEEGERDPPDVYSISNPPAPPGPEAAEPPASEGATDIPDVRAASKHDEPDDDGAEDPCERRP